MMRRTFGALASIKKCEELAKHSCEQFAKRGLKLEALMVGEKGNFELVVLGDLADGDLIELLEDLIRISHVAIGAISHHEGVIQ